MLKRDIIVLSTLGGDILKRLLITGFEPFGGETTNPSWEAVKLLPDEIGDFMLKKLRVPVVFGKAGETVLKTAKEFEPDVIICVGQAGGRAAITPEYIAVNIRNAKIPDNEGNMPQLEPIIPEGAGIYESTLPVQDIAEAVSSAGILSEVSFDAGNFVCNDLFYTVLFKYLYTDVLVCFIHVPFLPEQTNDKPSMELETIVKALKIAIESI